MRSTTSSIEAYIEQAPAERRDALLKLRALCAQVLVGFDEGIVYGMPSYSRNGAVEVSFASQKQFIALYILRQDALQTQRESLAGLSVGKGSIRYPGPEHIDFSVIKRMLEATRDSRGDIC